MNFIMICLVSLIASFILTILIMPFYIKALNNHNLSQAVSEYALDEYKDKAKTPIMGGLLFVLIPIVIYFVSAANTIGSRKTIFVLLSFTLFCLVGFLDDFIILIRKDNNGLSPVIKLILEFIFSLCLYFFFRNEISTIITIPFIKLNIDLGILYIPFMILVFLAEANAVNFTDGMDGLCAGVSIFGLISFLIIAYLNNEFNIVLLISSILGGLFGYLLFNYHPAKIFMGDSGSLALGGLFASLGIILNKEIALFIIGGIFVWEMFCVCLQLTWVKLFHKRIFKYTPIHYAFVLKGMKETKVVLMFYLLAFICSILGLYIGLN